MERQGESERILPMFDKYRFEFLVVVIKLQSDFVDVLFEIDSEYILNNFFLLVEGEIRIFKYFREHNIQIMLISKYYY